MGKKILARLLQSLRDIGVYTGEKARPPRRQHYFAMNPATGKMVRKTVSQSRARGKRKKTR
jgi:hypothetical protein